MSKKKAVCILVLTSVIMILCVVFSLVVYQRDRKLQENVTTQPDTVESVVSSVVEIENNKNVIVQHEGNVVVDGEEDIQYIIDDIGYDAYMQLINSDYDELDTDTSNVDKVIERYYRRQNITPQPLPKNSVEASGDASSSTEGETVGQETKN